MTDIEKIAEGLTKLQCDVLLWASPDERCGLLLDLPSLGLLTPKTAKLTKLGLAVRQHIKETT